MKKNIINLLIIALLVFLTKDIQAQISLKGLPYSFMASQNGRSNLLLNKTYTLKSIDNDAEHKRATEVANSCNSCGKSYYGTGINVSVDIKRDGAMNIIEGGKIWTYTFKSNSAYGMQFYFDKYKLPKKASLFIYNDDHSEILGAFTHINNYVDNRFATQIINGKEITVEYFEANENEFQGAISIYKVIHVFKNISNKKESSNGRTENFGDSESCNIDINCPEGQNYQDEKKAVCRLSYYETENNLTGFCTGSLLNSDQSIRNAYVLTAFHCAGHATPSEMVFEFDYEKSSCNSDQEPFTTQSHQGARIVTLSMETDYILYDLNVNKIEDYLDVNYLGWDIRSGVSFSNNVGISHPEGDVKKIAIDYDAAQSVNGRPDAGGNLFPYPNDVPKNYWLVSWNKGITQQGSSGSPLLNSAGMVIGLLNNGSSSCTAPNATDFYGQLNYIWDKNTAGAGYPNPLGHYLDPQNNGTKILANYIPNPASNDGGGDDGGGGSIPTNEGIIFLNPSYRLGDFTDLLDWSQLCTGEYPWKTTHGQIYIVPKKCIELHPSASYNLSGQDFSYPSGVRRAFDFNQDHEYILSIKVYDQSEGGIDKLSIHLTKGLPSILPCTTDRSNSYLGSNKQIMLINKDNLGRGWCTYAIKFVPAMDYSHIYLEATSTPRYTGQLLVDRIYLHERGNFTNPACLDDRIINDGTSIQNLEMANNSLVFEKDGSKNPIINSDRNVKAISHRIILRDGFSAKSGSTFYATANDCIEISEPNKPIGPLEKNIKSPSFTSARKDNDNSFVTDYSSFDNIHSKPEQEPNLLKTQNSAFLQIFPNPTERKAQIILDDSYDDYSVTVMTLQGDVLFEKVQLSGQLFEIDLNGYAAGIYFVKAAFKNKVIVGKVILK